MKFLGPISKDLTGPGAEELLAQARLLLGQVRNDMRLGGRQQGWGHWDLDDERRMRCYSNQNGAAPIDMVWIETIGGVVEPATFVMESGLLAWTEIDQEFPVKIYTGEALATYFAMDRSAYMQGTLEKQEDPPDSGEYSYVWPGDSPPMVNGQYDSITWVDQNPDNGSVPEFSEVPHDEALFNPCLFTGLMRLAVQAKIGARQGVQGLMPDGWGAADGRSHGLLVDPGGGYWICEITSNRCRAWPLLVDADVAAAVDGMAEPTDKEQVLGRAWKLAYATAAPLPDPQEGPSPEVMLWHQSEPLEGWPLAHGWHYNNAGTAAVAVYISGEGEGDRRSRGTLHAATFDFVKNEAGAYKPEGAVSASESGYFIFHELGTSLWIPAVDHYELLDGDAEHTYLCAGAVAPLYAFYDHADQCVILRYKTVKSDLMDHTIPIEGMLFSCSQSGRIAGRRKSAGGSLPTYSLTSGGFIIGNGSETQFRTEAKINNYISYELSPAGGSGGDTFYFYDRYDTDLLLFGPDEFGMDVLSSSGYGGTPCDICKRYAEFNENNFSNMADAEWKKLVIECYDPATNIVANDATCEYQLGVAQCTVVTSTKMYAATKQACFIVENDAEALVLATVDYDRVDPGFANVYQRTGFAYSSNWSATLWDTGPDIVVDGGKVSYDFNWGFDWGYIDIDGLSAAGLLCPVYKDSGFGITLWSGGDLVKQYEVDENISDRTTATMIGRTTVVLDSSYKNWVTAPCQNRFNDFQRDLGWAQVQQAWHSGCVSRTGFNQIVSATEGWPERMGLQRFIGGA